MPTRRTNGLDDKHRVAFACTYAVPSSASVTLHCCKIKIQLHDSRNSADCGFSMLLAIHNRAEIKNNWIHT